MGDIREVQRDVSTTEQRRCSVQIHAPHEHPVIVPLIREPSLPRPLCHVGIHQPVVCSCGKIRRQLVKGL